MNDDRSRPIVPIVPYSRPAAFQQGTRHASWADAGIRRQQIAQLAQCLRQGGVVVLSGAGVSTHSGIPDYRGPDGVRAQTNPMTYQQFTSDPEAAARYWARSFFGWRHIAKAEPNGVHAEVTRWQDAGWVSGVITQNVDGLHQRAGTRQVVELHGSLHRVMCLDCGTVCSRQELDRRLNVQNAQLNLAYEHDQLAPDGDVYVDPDIVSQFTMVGCLHCGSVRLKPDVVYFGESVPSAVVSAAQAMMHSAKMLLVLGSSLTVMSGYRFVRDAAKNEIPVGILTQGVSRGDRHATFRVDADLLPTVQEITVFGS